MTWYAIPPSVNGDCERESIPIFYLRYLYLSRSAFLVSFRNPDKQLTNVKSVFKSLAH